MGNKCFPPQNEEGKNISLYVENSLTDWKSFNWWKCYQLNKQNKIALPGVGTIHPSLLQEDEAAVLLFVAFLSGKLVPRGLESA